MRACPLIALAALFTGCSTCGYYQQAISGQVKLLAKRRSIDRVLADPQTSTELRTNLELVLELRGFAQHDLHLPVDGLYLSYAELDRSMAVWNVHAAPPFSLQPKSWWYPVVGRLQYRGFFSEEAARKYAQQLRADGYEVHVSGVEAYSTLGWFRDPVLSTFIHHAPADLAEILFHELAHQKLFISDETAWNEAFAVAVAEEGVKRWLTASGRKDEAEIFGRESRRNREFVELLTNTRDQLAGVYKRAATLRLDPHDPGPAWFVVEQEKARILSDLKKNFLHFKARWDGYSGYDRWFEKEVNNAQLATVNSYFRLVPLFQQLLAAKAGNLEQFYIAVEELSRAPLDQRQGLLLESILVRSGEGQPEASGATSFHAEPPWLDLGIN